MNQNRSDRSQMVNLLAEHTVLELDMVDTQDWTAMHRAAAFGTADDVKALLRLRASPLVSAPQLQWNAIHHAVHGQNVPTLVVMLDHCGREGLESLDSRGWSLLHVAAANQCAETIRELLRRGANPHCLSNARNFNMLRLFGQRLMPEDVAFAYGSEYGTNQYEIYRKTLLESGHLLNDIDEESNDEAHEAFFDAKEEFEPALDI
jgi:ankyrin repeat protein